MTHDNNNDPYRSAVISMPSSAQLGGAQPLPFVRFPFFPTAPWYSTNPNVGYQVRYYSTGILSTDTDFTVGAESIRTVQFDLPCRVIAFNGAAIRLSDPLAPIAGGTSPAISEFNMNNMYLFRVEYTTGDKLHTFPRLASTVIGTGSEPGEIGGHGYNVDQGASLQIGITPLVPDIRIDISIVCLEMRAPQNYNIR